MNRRSALLSAASVLLACGRAWGSSSGEGEADWDAKAARRYELERRHIELPQGRIAYIDRGAGEATLFLHGFPLNSFQWRRVIELMAPDRRCIAPDFLGLGLTEPADGQDVGPLAQVSMIIALLDRLQVERVQVIANDSGGAVAQLLMARHRQRLSSVLLTNCDTEINSPPSALDPVFEMARGGIYPDAWLVPWLNDKALARSPKGLGGMCYTLPSHPSDAAIDQYLAPLVATLKRKDLTNRYALALKDNALLGIADALAQCSVKTSIVWGMADPIFDRGGPEYLFEVIPSVNRVLTLSTAKLFFPEEFPEVIALEALRLAEVSRAGA
jgi:pimeloyl-ACP methyl ester carboxylesterase